MNWLECSIGIRYALVGRGDRFVSFASLASAIGIALGVATIIVVMSVMNGFHLTLREQILSTSSHIEIHNLAKSLGQQWPDFLTALSANDQVQAAAPIVDRQGLLSAGSGVSGALIKGIDPELEQHVSTATLPGEISNLAPGSFKIVLGKNLARKLSAKPNDKIVLMAPTAVQTLGGILPRFKTVTVAGTMDFGIYQFNESLVYMHYADAAQLFRVDGIDSIRLKLYDVYSAPQLADELKSEYGYPAFDWTSSNATLFGALAVERRVMFVILSLIIAVAAFQIVAALVTMVRAKRGAIAILRTMGMTSMAVLRIFLLQGMLVGLVGTIVGVGLGLLLAANVNEVVTFVENLFGFDFFPGEVYYLETIPSVIQFNDVFGTVVLAFGLSLLATVYPSLVAARLDPAEALRYE